MATAHHSDGCSATQAAIREGRADTADVRAHAAGCQACAELVASPELAGLLRAQGHEEALPDALAAAIAQQVATEPTRRPRGPRVGAAIVGLTGTSLLFGFLSARPDLASLPWGRASAVIVALAAAAGIGVWLVARPPWRAPLGPAQRWGGMAVLWGLPVLTLAFPLASPVGLGALSPATLLCLGYGSVMVVVSVGVLAATFRSDTLLGTRWPIAAATGAVFGNVALVVHCPAPDAGHILAGHVALGLLAAAAAALGSAMSLTPAGVSR